MVRSLAPIPSDVSDTIKTSVSTIRVDELQIIRVTYFEGVVLTIEEAKEEFEHAVKLVERMVERYGPEWPVRVMVDIRPMRATSREVREFFGSKEFSEKMRVTGLAIVVKSSISKLLANSFLSWNRPPHPTRIFTCVKGGEFWLQRLPPRDATER